MGKMLYLLRHGQTDYNSKGIVQGSGVDSSINKTGCAQADSFYRAYADLPFDTLLVSAMKRTQETVKPFIDSGMPYEIWPELNEISWGEFEGKVISAEEDAYYHWIVNEWQQGRTTVAIQGGESPIQVAQRLQRVVNRIKEGSEQHLLVCLHGRTLRILLCLLLNYPLHSMDMFEHHNTGLYVLNLHQEHFSVRTYNDTSHLQ